MPVLLEETIQVLLIDNDSDDARNIEEALEQLVFPSKFAVKHVSALVDGLTCLSNSQFAAVVLEVLLPKVGPIEALLALRQHSPNVPIVILTNLDDQQIGLQAMQEGAQDYLVKHRVKADSIARVIRYAIERNRADELLRQTARQAQEAEASLRLALTASETGIWSYDIATNKVTCDDQMMAMFNVDRSSFAATLEAFYECVHSEDRNRIKNAVEEAISKGTEYDFGYRVVWRDKSVHHLAASGRAVYDGSRKLIGITGVCRDVTKDKLQEANEKRLALLEQREEFIAMLAHDLRVPLIGAERIFAMLLAGSFGTLPQVQSELLSKIRNSNQSLLLMINNVLDVYRLEAGAERFVFTNVNLSAAVSRSVEELLPLAQGKGLQVECSIASIRDALADHLAIQRVLNNLLSNAIKFTSDGGRIEITVSDVDGRAALLRVSDTGVGMTAEQQERLFDRFWQANNTCRAIGFGLGLYLCHQLVDAHGGTISCSSKVGCGTTFEVRLPYAPQAQHTQVLIIDSMPITQQELKEYLRSLYVEADVACTSQQALEQIARKRYSAVFIDITMCEMDGFSTARKIREATVAVPIIGCAATCLSFDDRARINQAGISDVLERPLDHVRLKKMIHQWIDQQSEAFQMKK